tara:strand:- start:259 stop:537 length:279 start_codon:yes stop_codon:yes gene_type:complete
MTYLLASLFYLFAITVDIVDSPLHNALKNNPNLMAIKIQSRNKRRNLFLISGLIALILLVITRPFQILNSSTNANQFLNNIEDVSDIHIKNL